jgi:hypothetical protein
MMENHNPMNHLYSFTDSVKFLRNGAIVAAIASILLFWNSPHQAGEIATAIVVPLVIFNCIPIFLLGILDFVSRLRPNTVQKPLPLENQRTNTNALPLKYRMAAYGIVGMFVGFFAGIAIFLASFTYSSFGIPWAEQPARHLSYLLLGVSALPIVVAISFFAGIYYQAKFRNSGMLQWLSVKARHPFTYWPTTT